jgi:hypothetical protein
VTTPITRAISAVMIKAATKAGNCFFKGHLLQVMCSVYGSQMTGR